MSHEHRPTAYAALALAVCLWSTSAMFIRMVHEDLDPYSITFMRFSFALIPLMIYTWFRHRADFLRLIRQPKIMLPLTCVSIIQQTAWTTACTGMEAATAQFGVEMSVILVIIAGYVMYHEERAVITHPLFLFGTAVSILGLAGVLTSNPATLLPVLDRYTLFLTLCAVCWAIYSVWAKHLVNDTHPIPLFTAIVLFTLAGYLPIFLTVGSPEAVWSGGPSVWGILLLSGWLPLVLSHPNFYYAQKHLGVSFCGTMGLLIPLIALGLTTVFLPEEHLLPRQIAAGIVMIIGALLVTIAQRRALIRQSRATLEKAAA